MTKLNRKLTWPLILFVLFLMSVATTAFAATDPPSPDVDAAAWAKALYTAVTSKEWGIVAGLGLVGLVYVARRWLLGWVGWFKTPFGGLVLGFLVALASTMGLALAAGAKPSIALVFTSLSSAAAAAGVWEWIKAHVLKNASSTAPDPTPAPPDAPRAA